MSARGVGSTQLSDNFRRASNQSKPTFSGRKTKPFAIRFTEEERTYLQEKAGSRPLGAYCRGVLLGDRAEQRKVLRKPKIDQEQYAALLAALGQSRLSSNLNQLAKSANMGTLDVSQSVEQQLEDAYKAVIAMRDALIKALEIKLR